MTSLVCFVDDEYKRIMLRKYRTQECLFCQSTEGLSYFREHFICASCLGELNPGRQLGLLESAAAYDDGLKDYVRAKPSPTHESKQRAKHGESLKKLAEVMQSHPEASQNEWAHLIGVTPSRVGQLIRLLRERPIGSGGAPTGLLKGEARYLFPYIYEHFARFGLMERRIRPG